MPNDDIAGVANDLQPANLTKVAVGPNVTCVLDADGAIGCVGVGF